MKITGQILKENRERKGISVSEVALATKINTKTILAMEDGDLDRLPPKTFLRGFVRAYASYLELDVESLLNNFYEEMGSTKPKAPVGSVETAAGAAASPMPPRKASPGEADDAINPRTSTSVKIGAVAGILLLVVLIVFFKNKMDNYEKEAVVGDVPAGIESIEGSDAAPAGAGSSVPPTGTPSATPTESTPAPTPDAMAVVAPVASPTPSATPAAVVASPTPSATPTPTATPAATPSPTPAASPTPKATPRTTPTPGASPAQAGRTHEVIIEALNTVEVDAQIDGEAKKFKLSPDSVQAIKARRKVVLRFSDGGAVNLIVNGSDRGVPGDLGKPARIELP